MASLNKVFVMGYLGKDPEVRYTPAGTAVCNMRLATSRNWKNRDTGERMEETEWHSLVAYDRNAEIADQYLKKGGMVYVEGRLKTNKWVDKADVMQYQTVIVVDSIILMPFGGQDNDAPRERAGSATGAYGAGTPAQGTGAADAGKAPKAKGRAVKGKTKAAVPAGGGDDLDDDIPF